MSEHWFRAHLFPARAREIIQAAEASATRYHLAEFDPPMEIDEFQAGTVSVVRIDIANSEDARVRAFIRALMQALAPGRTIQTVEGNTSVGESFGLVIDGVQLAAGVPNGLVEQARFTPAPTATASINWSPGSSRRRRSPRPYHEDPWLTDRSSEFNSEDITFNDDITF